MPPSEPIVALAVDDEPNVSDLTHSYLTRSKDIVVDAAMSVKEAKEAIATKNYDVIVSDYQMPDEDGIQFLKWIRSTGSNTPFILFTGKGREEVAMEALNNGADAYVQKRGKPAVVYADLIHRIKDVVRRHRAEEALMRTNLELNKTNLQLMESAKVISSQFEDLRRGQSELMDQMAFSGSLMESLPGIFFLCHMETLQLVRWNRNFQRLTGNSDEEMLGKHLLDWCRREDSQMVASALKRCVDERQVSFEASLVMKDGLEIPFMLSGVCLVIAGRTYLAGMGFDISRRLLAEMSMREQESKYRMLTENMKDVVWVLDMDDWRFLYLSPSAEKLSGFTVEEIMAEAPEMTLHPNLRSGFKAELQARHRAFIKEGREERQFYRDEIQQIRKDGSFIWTEVVSSMRISNKTGHVELHGVVRDIEARRQAEYDLSIRNMAIVSSINAFAFSDMDGMITFANPAFLSAWGCDSFIDVSGRPFSDFCDSAEKADQILKEMREKGSGVGEVVAKRIDGSRFPVSFSANVVKDATGEPICMMASFNDITERKKAEEGLREVSAYSRSLIEASLDPLVTIDANGRITDVNDATVMMTGLPRESIIGTDFSNYFSEPQKAREGYQRVFQDGEVRDYPLTLVGKDGRRADVLYNASVIRDSDGRVKGVFAAARDVTELKKAEDAKEETWRRLENVIESTHVGTWEWNVQTGETVFNERWAHIIGYTLEELAPVSIKTWTKFAHPEDLKYSDLTLARHFSGELPYYQFECRMRHKDGHWIWVIDSGQVVKWTADGKPLIMLGTHADITERKRAEISLREANRKLNLLSSITRHDITNQLLVINGSLELLEVENPTQETKENIARITMAAERISRMVQFTKEYENIGVRAPVWQDVGDLVAAGVASLQLGPVKVINDVPEGTKVFADPLITKVFHNLIGNALLHGQKVSRVQFSLEEGTGCSSIVCSDDGIGLAEKTRKSLFMPGFNRDHGMGLYLSKEILAITEISIREEGKQGNGARFVMSFPQDGVRMAKDALHI